MVSKTATVIGATGLTGSHLVQLLQIDDSYDSVRLLVRKPLAIDHPKVEVKLVDFDDRESFQLGIAGSAAVFCSIGTTQKKVKGDRESYKKVDYGIPVMAAELCKATHCFNFALVSAVGANSASKNFYLKLKGETENAIRDIKIPCTSIFRPSFLLGKRKEFRFGELIAKAIMPVISPVLVGKWNKYKAVESHDLARAMIHAAKLGKFGLTIYEYEGIMELARG